MPGWDASDVKEKLEDLEKRQADRKQLHWVHPALPSDDAAWLATRQAFTSSAEALFKAFGEILLIGVVGLQQAALPACGPGGGRCSQPCSCSLRHTAFVC